MCAGRSRVSLSPLWTVLLLWPVLSWADTWSSQRAEMVGKIAANVSDTASYINKRALSPAVMTVMGKVPRHRFVPIWRRHAAYENHPLPIGHGQTISQPYIVALMTDMLEPKPGDRVLEVGTGSGYQAAVLAELVERVYTVEIIPELGEAARERLKTLGYRNIRLRVGDGYYGWPEYGPFDSIIVTAAGPRIPPPLIQQLKPGGRMVIPVGDRFTAQELLLIIKDKKQQLTVRKLLPVMFVPLTGGH